MGEEVARQSRGKHVKDRPKPINVSYIQMQKEEAYERLPNLIK
jgi:hypothetical protein